MRVLITKLAQETHLQTGDTTSAITILLPTGVTVVCFIDPGGFHAIEDALRCDIQEELAGAAIEPPAAPAPPSVERAHAPREEPRAAPQQEPVVFIDDDDGGIPEG